MAKNGPTPVCTSAKKKFNQSRPRSVPFEGGVFTELLQELDSRTGESRRTLSPDLDAAESVNHGHCRQTLSWGYVLRGSNYLDTRVAGSYNRRPLSPGTSAGHCAR